MKDLNTITLKEKIENAKEMIESQEHSKLIVDLMEFLENIKNHKKYYNINEIKNIYDYLFFRKEYQEYEKWKWVYNINPNMKYILSDTFLIVHCNNSQPDKQIFTKELLNNENHRMKVLKWFDDTVEDLLKNSN